MADIYFPASYRRALIRRTKSITLRTGREIGKYKTGKTYNAKSYAGKDWGISVKILKTRLVHAADLLKYGIPPRSVRSLRQKTYAAEVEIIKFKQVK